MDNINISSSNIICPISHQIYLEPVLARDGFTYERVELVKWLNKESISPITREKIPDDLIPNNSIKSIVNEYLVKYPDMKKNQYSLSKDYNDNVEIVKHLVVNKKFSEILKFRNYNIKKLMSSNTLKELLTYCKDFDIIK